MKQNTQIFIFLNPAYEYLLMKTSVLETFNLPGYIPGSLLAALWHDYFLCLQWNLYLVARGPLFLTHHQCHSRDRDSKLSSSSWIKCNTVIVKTEIVIYCGVAVYEVLEK